MTSLGSPAQPAKPGVGAEFRRLLIACAFVLGTGSFVALAGPLLVGAFVDYVPVVPIALMTVVAVGLLGGIAVFAACRRWWSMILGLGCGTAAGFAAALIGQAMIWVPAQGSLAWGLRPFDSDRWSEASTRWDGYNPRGKMVSALMMSPSVRRGTRAQVIDRLGAPDCPGTPAHEDAWSIGYWSGLQIDPDCLHVAYNDAGRVDALRVKHH